MDVDRGRSLEVKQGSRGGATLQLGRVRSLLIILITLRVCIYANHIDINAFGNEMASEKYDLKQTHAQHHWQVSVMRALSAVCSCWKLIDQSIV